MPPENVRYPPSLRAKKYIKNTLPKCYNQLPKRSKIKEALASKNGYRRFYVNEKGELYRGWWKNDMQDGLGIQSDVVHYIVNEGEYHHGKAWGYGVTCKVEPNKMEDILYGGEFVNGVPEGQGEIHTDTYHFKGNVVNGKSSGVGVAWYDDGTIYFGSWFNGKRMGQGMQILRNMNRFEGNWYNDLKHGYGQYYFFDRGQVLEGIWVADSCEFGNIRNIKYRQSATNSIKYALPKLMLKDVDSCYYNWENKALANVGLYVRNDMQIKHEKEVESKTFSIQEAFKPMDKELEDRLIPRSHLFRFGIYSKLDPAITDAQPCYAFYD